MNSANKITPTEISICYSCYHHIMTSVLYIDVKIVHVIPLKLMTTFNLFQANKWGILILKINISH